MKRLLVTFGDSWTFGSELHDPQTSAWPVLVASQLDAECVNLGTPASSIGHLVVQLFDFLHKYPDYKEYKTIFMVGLTAQSRYLSYCDQLDEFVNITPDAVYRTGNIKKTGQPPEDIEEYLLLKDLHYKLVDNKNYSNFLLTQTLFLFQQFVTNKKIDCIYFSYFDQLENFENNIIDDKLIYPATITHALTGQEYEIPTIRDNRYFANKLFHPNELGHQAIAELLFEFYEKDKRT